MLGEQEIKKLKSNLKTEQKYLVEELSRLEKPEAIDMGSDTDHYEEETDEAEETSINIGLNQSIKERLEGIKAALFKIEQGKFGFCEKCGSEIEKEVFNVDPESRWCQSCKTPNY